MPEFIQQYGIIALKVAAVAYIGCMMMGIKLPSMGGVWTSISTRFARTASSAGQPVSVDIDQDTLEHQATMLLAARADRRKSPECKEAIKKYQSHWLDDNSRTEG